MGNRHLPNLSRNTVTHSLYLRFSRPRRSLNTSLQLPVLKANLKDICSNAGIHNSKGYAILNTLQKADFVNRNKNKVVFLGFRPHLGRTSSP